MVLSVKMKYEIWRGVTVRNYLPRTISNIKMNKGDERDVSTAGTLHTTGVLLEGAPSGSHFGFL